MPNSRFALHGFSPSLIHGFCAFWCLIHGLCAFFRLLLTPLSTAPSPPPSQFTVCTSRFIRPRVKRTVGVSGHFKVRSGDSQRQTGPLLPWLRNTKNSYAGSLKESPLQRSKGGQDVRGGLGHPKKYPDLHEGLHEESDLINPVWLPFLSALLSKARGMKRRLLLRFAVDKLKQIASKRS